MDVHSSQPSQDSLKPRELEILRLIAAGWSNQEIAEELYLARDTVRWYIKQIYGKLGVEDRAQAVATAARLLGQLESDTSGSDSPLPPPRQDMPRNNLPVQLSPFVGRERELAELADLLSDETIRLITLLAPGGMGKTRLALEAAKQQIDNFADGIYFVPLAAASVPEQIITMIGENIIDFRFQAGSEPKHQLLNFLRERQILLLLDNFEHLLAGADLLLEVLQAAPLVKVLLTSRERLNMNGEVVFRVDGLSIPGTDTAEDALDYSAVKLFVQQAQQTRRDFVVKSHDLPHITHVCRLVAAMPLAIVLAAVWVEILTPEEIAREIAAGLDFLVVERRDLPERLRSVRVVFDYSWKRLSAAEQSSFSKLAVFRGGFTRQAAQVVAGASVQTLQALLNKALVSRMSSGRYEIHEVLRHYAEERLELSQEVTTTRDDHSQYYLAWLADLEADIKGRRQAEALIEIEADVANITAAWNWAVSQKHYVWLNQAVECLFWFSIMSYRYQEGGNLFGQAERAVQDNTSTETLWGRLTVRKLDNLAYMLGWGNSSEVLHGEARIRQALAIAREHEDRLEIARNLYFWASHLYRVVHDYQEAFTLFEESLAEFSALSDQFYGAWVLLLMGSCTRHIAGIAQSTVYFEQSLKLRQLTGDMIGENMTKTNFGINLLLAGSLAEAEIAINSLDITEAAGFAEAMLGLISFLRSDSERAGALVTQAHESVKRNPFSTTYSLTVSLQSVLGCFEERYTNSIALAQEGRVSSSLSYCVFFADWALALAYAGSEDYESTRNSISAALNYAHTVKANGAMVWCLPPVAAVLVSQGEVERAVEALSLAFHHPSGEHGWMEKMPWIIRLRSVLEAKLGTDAYLAAWQRGESLDLEQVVSSFKEEGSDIH